MKFGFKFLNQYKHEKRPWFFYRIGKKGRHTHLKTKAHCKSMRYWLENNIMPHDDNPEDEAHLIESTKRVLTVKEFSKLKGVKKC